MQGEQRYAHNAGKAHPPVGAQYLRLPVWSLWCDEEVFGTAPEILVVRNVQNPEDSL